MSEEIIEFGAHENSETQDKQFFDDELKRNISEIPDKMAFKIGEVADLLRIKPYVLRYWETEFDALKPKKSNQNQRMYSRKDVETAFFIKKLLYRDRFSIEGARKALKKLKSEAKKDKQDNTLVFSEVLTDVKSLLRQIQSLKARF
jgi:DNA-binding transcriptional MerR regulator